MVTSNVNKSKFWAFLLFLVVFTTIFWVRAFYLQVLESNKYDEWKKVKYWRKNNINASRGKIFDRNGNLLAQDVVQYKIIIEPHKIKNRESVREYVQKNFPGAVNDFKTLFNKKRVVYIEKNAHEEDAVKLKAFRQKSKEWFIYSRPFYKRIYPYEEYAGQVLGYVNHKNSGVSGIELTAEKYLKGKDGKEYTIITPKGAVWENVDMPAKGPVPGADVYLTIDLDLQAIAEEELFKAVKSHKAIGGMVVVMQPKTGEVLAISSIPRFDPNNPGKFDEHARKNRAITDIFEPGSTFKVVPAAALLESGKVTKDSIIYCENGEYKLYKNVIHDHKKYGWLTFEKVIANSSNIGIAKLSRAYLTNNYMYQKIKDFGFGQKTGIDLPGEAIGLFKAPKKWSGLTKASVSFGHEIGVTAIQIAVAFSTVANSGSLYKPFLIKEVKDFKGKQIFYNEPKSIRKVISDKTAQTLKEMLGEAVKTGTGIKASLEDIAVGGKTGTAQKLKKNGSGYSHKNYIASFVGFFPLKEPEFVILIMLDSPNSPYHTGGLAAAPAFKNIVKNITGIPTFYQKISETISDSSFPFIIDFYGKNFNEVKKILAENEIKYLVKGEGEFVIKQNIKNQQISENEKLVITLGDIDFNYDELPMFKGKSLKEAISVLNQLKIDFAVEGNGMVVRQYPKAGTSIKKIYKVKLVCKSG